MSLEQRINGAVRRIPAWPVYVLFPLPGLWLFWEALNDRVGANPIQVLEHEYGERGLQLIVLALLITPVRRLTGVNLLKFRRAVGVVSFVYVFAHMMTWLVLDQQLDIGAVWTEIVDRPYITVGMIGFAALLPLAATSNNLSVRRLGPARWRRIHALTYFAAIAGAAHYLLVVKAWPAEPVIYSLVVAALLAIRLWWRLAAKPRR